MKPKNFDNRGKKLSRAFNSHKNSTAHAKVFVPNNLPEEVNFRISKEVIAPKLLLKGRPLGVNKSITTQTSQSPVAKDHSTDQIPLSQPKKKEKRKKKTKSNQIEPEMTLQLHSQPGLVVHEIVKK